MSFRRMATVVMSFRGIGGGGELGRGRLVRWGSMSNRIMAELPGGLEKLFFRIKEG